MIDDFDWLLLIVYWRVDDTIIRVGRRVAFYLRGYATALGAVANPFHISNSDRGSRVRYDRFVAVCSAAARAAAGQGVEAAR